MYIITMYSSFRSRPTAPSFSEEQVYVDFFQVIFLPALLYR